MNLASDRPRTRHDAIESGRHPPDDRVPDPALNVLDGIPSVTLVPLAIEVLGYQAELDDEVG
jgi:ABC-type nitrate/sulfonate/bicarbonate transport system permease component